MTKNKSNLVKYVGAPLMALSIFVGSQKINAQTKGFQKPLTKEAKLELNRGYQLGRLVEETENSFIYKYNFSKKVSDEMKNSKSPRLFTTDKKVTAKFNEDTTGAIISVPKDYFNSSGESKKFAMGALVKGINADPCNSNSYGSKYHPLFSSFFVIENGKLENPYGKFDQSAHDSLFKKIGTLEKEVSEVDSVTRSNSTKLDTISARLVRNWDAYIKSTQNKKESKENKDKKRLKIITSGVIKSPRYFNEEIQYDIIQGKGFSLGPFASVSLGNGETNVAEDIKFREVTPWGTNSSKERKDVYQTEGLTKYLGSIGARATGKIGSFYSFVEAGVNVVKDRLKTFGTAYVNYFKDGKKLNATNKEPISNSAAEENVYRFPIKGALGLGVDINDYLSIEGKVSKELNQGGKLEGYAGLSVRF